MGIFKTDKSQASVPVRAGTYEVIISDGECGRSANGNQKVTLDYTIRNDVPQQAQNKKVRYDNFTFTEKSMGYVQNLCNAVGLPEGIDFDTTEEFLQAVLFKPLRIRVELKAGFNKPDQLYPTAVDYLKTLFPICSHVQQQDIDIVRDDPALTDDDAPGVPDDGTSEY